MNGWPDFALGFGIAGVAAVYLLQLLSPLRLNTDAVAYLSLAASLNDGAGLTFRGETTHFPPGYPAMIAGLERLGLGVSAGIIGLNLLFLAVGVAVYGLLLRRSLGLGRQAAAIVGLLTLLSFVNIKHAVLPLSDIAFLALSSLALLALSGSEQAENRKRLLLLAAALLAAVLATLTRSVGVALFPALVLALLRRDRLADWLHRIGRRRAASAGLALLGLAAGALWIVWDTPMAMYVREAAGKFDQLGGLAGISRVVGFRALELGELTLNLPVSRVPPVLQAAVPVVGVVSAAGVLLGLWRRRRDWGAVEVFFAVYMAIILVWPYYDPRFLLPVFPLLLGYVALAVKPVTVRAFGRGLAVAAVAWFAVTGGVALAVTTHTSLAGEAFPERYGSDPSMRLTYRAAFMGVSSGPCVVYPDMLFLLQRFERRALPHSSPAKVDRAVACREQG